MGKEVQKSSTSLKYSKVNIPFNVDVNDSNRGELYKVLYNVNHLIGEYLRNEANPKCISMYVASKKNLSILLENNTCIPFKSKNMKSVTRVLKEYKETI